jgi:transposase
MRRSPNQLRISKRGDGDAYLRRLLVSAAHYILGPFGPQSALRAYGLMLAADGTARAKKRVAVARKLAVLLLSLWKSQQPYQPFPGSTPQWPTSGPTIRNDCGASHGSD